jgi:hypothetical protein
MVNPAVSLPGIYMARVVATLDNNVINEISTGAHGSPPLVLSSPCGNCDVNNDQISSQRKGGSGESQPELPPNRLRRIAIDRLQGVAILLQKESFLPVGNRFFNQNDTKVQNLGREGTELRHTKETNTQKLCKE